jgi:hypothetical protein
VHLDAAKPLVAEFVPSPTTASGPTTSPILSGIELIVE